MHCKANMLFRYKVISEEYKKHTSTGLPTTQIFTRFIYPKFFISIRTLYSILSTPIDKELKGMGYSQEQINAYVAKYKTEPIASEPQLLPTSNLNPYMQPKRQNQIF